MVIVILIVLGLCAGSFVNALVWRLHEQEESPLESTKTNKSSTAKKKDSKKSTKVSEHSGELSILNGRSMCPRCHHGLAWYDLVPVLSWLSLRGKCRYCNKPISVQYPVVELLMAIIFVLFYVFWPFSLSGAALWLVFAGWLVATVLFMALIIYDLRWMLLPNRLIYPLGVISLSIAIISLIAGGDTIFTTIWQPILGVAVVGGFFALLYFVSSGRWMGFGDVRLSVIIGLLLGWQLGLVALISSFYIGAIVVLPIMFAKKLKAKTKVPFGPFMIVAVYVALFWGQAIIDWYLHTIVGLG